MKEAASSDALYEYFKLVGTSFPPTLHSDFFFLSLPLFYFSSPP